MRKKMERRNFLKGTAIATVALLTGLKTKILMAGQIDHAPLLSNSENDTLKTIHSLRTIHGNFTDRPISSENIDTILQASIQAPNASGLQSYSIVTITDQKRMQKICGYKGGTLLLYCVDYNRLLSSAEHHNKSYNPEGIQSFITGSTNTILALQTAVIAAKALGIDALTTNGIHRGDMQRVWDEIELPEKYCYPLIALVLGYPKNEPEFHKGRLDGAGIFHTEKYKQVSKEELKEITKKYDDENTHLAMNRVWEKEHKHYFDWLFTKWLGRSSAIQDQKTQTFKLLKRAGFIKL